MNQPNGRRSKPLTPTVVSGAFLVAALGLLIAKFLVDDDNADLSDWLRLGSSLLLIGGVVINLVWTRRRERANARRDSDDG